jgi:hypothetical protein
LLPFQVNRRSFFCGFLILDEADTAAEPLLSGRHRTFHSTRDMQARPEGIGCDHDARVGKCHKMISASGELEMAGIDRFQVFHGRRKTDVTIYLLDVTCGLF